VAWLYLQALGSLFVASHDLQGYGGDIGPRLHTESINQAPNLVLFISSRHGPRYKRPVSIVTAQLLHHSCPRERVYRAVASKWIWFIRPSRGHCIAKAVSLTPQFLLCANMPHTVPAWSQGSAVGIAIGYGLDDRGVGVRVPVRSKNFLFSKSSRPALGSTKSPIQWVPRSLSPGVKRQGREADHSPPASAEVKKMWIFTSTSPYAFMA
jgi:hypothetical protein